MKENNYLGIDPDVTKSGVAFYESKTNKLELANLSFFQLFDYLNFVKEAKQENQTLKVIIEAGWLNKSNWHAVKGGNSSINAQIGQRTGANHEVGKKIAEMCNYLGLTYELVKPTKSKVNAEFFKKVTGVIGRTNQEQRDAGMLVYDRK